MLALSPGDDYDFFREEDVGNFGATIMNLFSNMTYATTMGYTTAELDDYIAALASYQKAIIHVVNDNVGGSTRNDSLQELGYCLQAIVGGFQVLDYFQSEYSSLASVFTATDRENLIAAWKTIMDYAMSIQPNWTDGSFSYYAYSGVTAASLEAARQSELHSISADMTTYLSYAGQMFAGFFGGLPGLINTTVAETYTIDGRIGMLGDGAAVYEHWGEWPSNMTVSQSSTADIPQSMGTISDSSTYGWGDMLNFGSSLLMLRNSNTTSSLAVYASDSYAKSLADFIESYTPLFMGWGGDDTGFVPPYGDANWGDSVSWHWVVMDLAASLVKTIDPAQASRLKYYSNMASRYSVSQPGSLSLTWRYRLSSAESVVATAPAAVNVTSSMTRHRQSTHGEIVADKVVLRGANTDPGQNGYALVDAVSARSFGHAHPSPGNIIAHTHNSAITLRSLGYAADYDTLQNNFAVRRTPNATNSFLSYEQLSGTVSHNSPIEAFSWSAPALQNNQAITRDVTQHDTDRIAYTSITADIITGNGLSAVDEYNFHAFNRTRQTVLDKTNGALYIYDSVRPHADITTGGVFSFGQIWHVSQILRNVTTASGYTSYVAQNGPHYVYQDSAHARGRPFLLQVAGGDSRQTVWWDFEPAMTGNTVSWSQYHIHSQADVTESMSSTTSQGFVTVIVPFGNHCNLTAVEADEVPSGVVSTVDSGGNAVAGYDGLCISFFTNGSYAVGAASC
ncbi:hypothetical protein MBLNU459_g3562t1 [Dothideomycetes sp. NU459]